MPSILKRFKKNEAEDYHFRDMEEATAALQDMVRLKESLLNDEPPEPEEKRVPFVEEREETTIASSASSGSIEFARTQAQAIIRDAEQQAEAIIEQARRAVETEVAQIQNQAVEAGYEHGYQQGLEEGRKKAMEDVRSSAQDSLQKIQSFLQDAAEVRDREIDHLKVDLLSVAVAVAEKVIRISLKSSKDIINRMIIAGTEKLKKRAWVRIYLADCDVSGTVATDPALASTLAGLSSQVKIIPMQDAESGTCVVEMPDQIIDVSTSTQLDNIRTIIRDSR